MAKPPGQLRRQRRHHPAARGVLPRLAAGADLGRSRQCHGVGRHSSRPPASDALERASDDGPSSSATRLRFRLKKRVYSWFGIDITEGRNTPARTTSPGQNATLYAALAPVALVGAGGPGLHRRGGGPPPPMRPRRRRRRRSYQTPALPPPGDPSNTAPLRRPHRRF